MVIIFTAAEMMTKGLCFLPNFDTTKLDKLYESTKLDAFRNSFGVTPVVAAALWRDLQTCDIQANQINPRKALVEYFFIALHFLRKYPTGKDQTVVFPVCRETASTWTWFFLDKIAKLKSQKIVWPAEWEKDRYAAARQRSLSRGEPVVVTFGCTVDGTHGRIHEPSVGETRAQNPIYYSHKSNGPAFAYEFALDIFSERLVWMNGPFPASTPDREIFKQGLMAKIPDGMRVIADSGYSGEPLELIISARNPHDHKDTKKLKRRAKSRQEAFNNILKRHRICGEIFRHDKDRKRKHEMAWTAVAVICQYHMELDASFWAV